MASTQVPVNTVMDPSDLQQNVPMASQVSTMNDVQGRAVTPPTPQIVTVGSRIIRG